MLSRNGTNIDDFIFRRQFLSNIRLATSPIVSILFGTCDLTTKKGKFIEFGTDVNNFEKVDRLIVKYRYLKSDILRNNSHATVVFLKCPYYSIVEWNRQKGSHDISPYSSQDILLNSTVDYLNHKLDSINSILITNLSQDIIRSSKKKGDNQVKYSKNFGLYLDGIHPGSQLSLLWLHRILKLKHQIEHQIESSKDTTE